MSQQDNEEFSVFINKNFSKEMAEASVLLNYIEDMPDESRILFKKLRQCLSDTTNNAVVDCIYVLIIWIAITNYHNVESLDGISDALEECDDVVLAMRGRIMGETIQQVAQFIAKEYYTKHGEVIPEAE